MSSSSLGRRPGYVCGRLKLKDMACSYTQLYPPPVAGVAVLTGAKPLNVVLIDGLPPPAVGLNNLSAAVLRTFASLP